MFRFKIYTEDKVIHYVTCVMLSWDKEQKRVVYYERDSEAYTITEVEEVELIWE